FSAKFLRQKIKTAPDRAAFGDQTLRLGDMGSEPIELFANVSLGREHDRFLVQTVTVEPLRGCEQGRYLLGKPRLDSLRLAARRSISACRERRDFLEPRREHAAKGRPFLAAHGQQRRERIDKSGGDRL